MGISVLVEKLTHRQTGYVPCIVFQNGVDRFHVTASSRFNDGKSQTGCVVGNEVRQRASKNLEHSPIWLIYYFYFFL